MTQEIFPPNSTVQLATTPRDLELIDNSIERLRGKMNFVDRLRESFKAGENAADVIAGMRGDVLQANRDVIQHHAQMIAREKKIQITDAYQAGIANLTRRVNERVDQETRYYWEKLTERMDHYEDFFGGRVAGYEERVRAGQMARERAAKLIEDTVADRDKQIARDRALIDELQEAIISVVRRAIKDHQT